MWTYVLVANDGDVLGEVRNAADRQLSLGINKVQTASFTIRPDNERMLDLYREDTFLRVYEDTTLRYQGYVVTAEFADADNSPGSIKVTSADAAWRLSRRITGKSSGGTAHTGDKAKSARKIINEANTEGETRVKVLAEGEYSAGGSGNYTAGPYKPALSCINDLAHGFDGFDWRIDPLIEGEKIGTFVAKPTIGETEPVATFERGWGTHNVRTMTFSRSIADLANIAYHLPDNGVQTEGATVKSSEDAASKALRGRFEAVTEGYGLTDSTLREKWVQEFVRVRCEPRYVAGMTLDINDGTGRVPQYGTDFVIGDMVKARGVLQGQALFDGLARVYAVNFAINNAGTATVTPILIDEEGEQLAA